MKKPFCNNCQYVGQGEGAEEEDSCPNCGTPLTLSPENPQPTQLPKPVGFGTEKPSSRRRGTGWGS